MGIAAAKEEENKAESCADIKPDNILLNLSPEDNNEPVVQQVQLVDLENAVHIPPGGGLGGAQLGNWMRRSPESHPEGPIDKPSDVISFGLVASSLNTDSVLNCLRLTMRTRSASTQ